MTAYFTFGQVHAHAFNGVTLDKDIVIEMESPDPRASMLELFGVKWSMQYDEPPNMAHFPRGIFKIQHTPINH